VLRATLYAVVLQIQQLLRTSKTLSTEILEGTEFIWSSQLRYYFVIFILMYTDEPFCFRSAWVLKDGAPCLVHDHLTPRLLNIWANSGKIMDETGSQNNQPNHLDLRRNTRPSIRPPSATQRQSSRRRTTRFRETRKKMVVAHHINTAISEIRAVKQRSNPAVALSMKLLEELNSGVTDITAQDGGLVHICPTGAIPYGLEYIGPVSRLVILPLTERSMFACAQAVATATPVVLFGGSGVGKMSLVEELSKEFATPLFTASVGSSWPVTSVMHFFHGLSVTGFWGCMRYLDSLLPEVHNC
jgi:hypothetical protein